MGKVLAYVRVSSDEQAESRAGIEAQRHAILAEAERRGWSIPEIEWIEDGGYSGKDLKRPGIAIALDALRRKQADTLVVAKVDRLSRSVADFGAVMEMASRQHWALIALDVGVDTSSPQGEMLANLLATFSRYERRLIAQRTREALRAKKAAGVRLGRSVRIPADVIAEIVDLRADGRTFRSIAEHLNERGTPTFGGGTRWHASTIRSVAMRSAGQDE